MSHKVRKIILPVAGIGKRLMPLTLTTPKNLIPLAGRPIVSYILDEIKKTELEEVVLIVSPQHQGAYEEYIEEAGREYPKLKFHIRVQAEPLGHGHAILQAEDLIGEEPFLMRFCDDIILGGQPTLTRLIELYEKKDRSAVLLARGPKEVIVRYGVVVAEPVLGEPDVYQISNIIEKPPLAQVPSELYVIGGYVLGPEILKNLKEASLNMAHAADALPVYSGIDMEFKKGNYVYGWEFDGHRLDCGTLEGLKEAEEYMQRNKIA